MAKIEIVGGERFGDLDQLQTVAELIFGRGQRQPNWLGRKLRREGVEPGLSAVALRGDVVQGYVLLGRAASLGQVARGAGVGVVPGARGQGLGRALIEFASARAQAAGCSGIEFLAAPERLDWYLRQGFGVVESQLSLLGFGLGGDGPLVAGCRAGASLGRAPVWTWVPEVWARTPADERAVVELEGGRVWLTREGRAWLAHRLERESADVSVVELLSSLRRRVAVTTPLILYPCGAGLEAIGSVLASGFEIAQRSHVVRR